MSPSIFPPPKERVARHCVCCGSGALNKSPAVLMPFLAHRVFGWAPVEITGEWGLRSLATGHAYTICNSVQCSACAHLFLDIRFDDTEMGLLYDGYRGPAYTALREHYEPGYAERNTGLNVRVSYLDRIESFLSPYVAPLPRVLDWGGDTGENTPYRDHAAALDIYDISNKTELVAGARKVDRASALAQDYDVVVCSNVLEHVPYPHELVADLKLAMRPETVLYLEIPRENLVLDSDPLPKKRHWHEHINFYTETSLRTLLDLSGLETLGYQVLQVEVGSASWSLYQLACRLRPAQAETAS